MSGPTPATARGAMPELGESLAQSYWRRFRKHQLGKIGAAALLVLYGLALLADPLSPATMRWTDKTKSYQPPTRVHFSYADGGRVVVRPFTFEMRIVNQALRTYGRVPRHTIRVISQETVAGRGELRAAAMQDSATARASAAVTAFRRHYGLAPDHAATAELRALIAEVERDPRRDLHRTVRLAIGRPSAPTAELIIAKGNKNFVGFLVRGVPYRVLGCSPPARTCSPRPPPASFRSAPTTPAATCCRGCCTARACRSPWD